MFPHLLPVSLPVLFWAGVFFFFDVIMYWLCLTTGECSSHHHRLPSNVAVELSVVSVATDSWTCFQTRLWFEKSSRNLMTSSNRASEISRVSSEPMTQPSLTPYRYGAAGVSLVELVAVINWPAARDKEAQERWWTALWLVALWETGYWLLICSDSCRGSGLKIKSRNPPIRVHWIQNITTITTKEKGEGRRNEGENWVYKISNK